MVGDSGKTSKTTTKGSVFVHDVEHDDLGYTTIMMDHTAFPKLRFTVGLSPEGIVTGFEVCDRRFRARSPELDPTDPAWGPSVSLTRRLLAKVPFGDLERAARDRVNEDRGDAISGKLELDEDSAWLAELPPTIGAPKRGGRTPLPDIHYATIARDYVHFLGEPHPVAALGHRYTVSRNTAKGWVQEARSRTFLTDPPPSDGPIGKPGGLLTKRARQILREEQLQ